MKVKAGQGTARRRLRMAMNLMFGNGELSLFSANLEKGSLPPRQHAPLLFL